MTAIVPLLFLQHFLFSSAGPILSHHQFLPHLIFVWYLYLNTTFRIPICNINQLIVVRVWYSLKFGDVSRRQWIGYSMLQIIYRHQTITWTSAKLMLILPQGKNQIKIQDNFFHGNALECVIFEMSIILLESQCLDWEIESIHQIFRE